MSKRRRNALLIVIVILIVADIVVAPLKVDHVHVSLSPETLGYIGRLPITNSLLGSWLAMVVLMILAWRAHRHLELTPKAGSMQNIMEAVIETLTDYLQRFAGERARAFLPIAGSLFLYILGMNWLSLLPGFGSVGFWQTHEGQKVLVPLLRGGTADLNTTIALAVISGVASQFYGVRFLGIKNHLLRFFPIQKPVAFFGQLLRGKKPSLGLLLGGVLDMFIGLLEIVEEATKVLSFAFRLFGNIFGGEVLLSVMAFLMPYLASLPFMALEVFFGFIQAVIFTFLSTAFFARATARHDQHKEAEPDPVTANAAQPA